MLHVMLKKNVMTLFLSILILSWNFPRTAFAEGGRNGPDLKGKAIAVDLDRGISARNVTSAIAYCWHGNYLKDGKTTPLALEIARALNKSFKVSISGGNYSSTWGPLELPENDIEKPNEVLFSNGGKEFENYGAGNIFSGNERKRKEARDSRSSFYILGFDPSKEHVQQVFFSQQGIQAEYNYYRDESLKVPRGSFATSTDLILAFDLGDANGNKEWKNI